MTVLQNRRREDGQTIQGWIRTLWPIVIVVLAGWFWLGAADANQTMSVDQFNKIEAKIEVLNQNQINIKVTLEGLRKDIEYLKRGNGYLNRIEKSELSPGEK